MSKTIRIGMFFLFINLISVRIAFADNIIPQDTTYNGTLFGQTVMWFAVPVNVDGNLSVTLNPSDGVNMQLKLCTPEKNEITRNDCWGNSLTLNVNGLKPDTYYISIWGYYGNLEGHGYTLTTEFSIAELENDIEPNNNSGDANSFPINGKVTGHIGYDGRWASNPADEIDWWKITTLEDGILTVTIAQVDPVNLQLAIFRPDGSTEIMRADTGGDTTRLTINNLREGTYFIRVFKYAWNFTPYTLENIFTTAPGANDPEPNNSIEEASELTVNVLSNGHLGYDGFRDNLGFDSNDWWHFTLQNTCDLQLTLTQIASANLRPFLYKEDGITIVNNGGDTWGNGYEMNVQQASPGKYYMKIGTYGVFDSYTLLLMISNITGIEEETSEIPTQYNLIQNFPNPFNPSTVIKYDIPKNTSVKIILYNSIGQQIRELVNKNHFPGYYSYIIDGTMLSSGVYFYQIITDDFIDSKKMILMK